jgi:hypothetical protein
MSLGDRTMNRYMRPWEETKVINDGSTIAILGLRGAVATVGFLFPYMKWLCGMATVCVAITDAVNGREALGSCLLIIYKRQRRGRGHAESVSGAMYPSDALSRGLQERVSMAQTL